MIEILAGCAGIILVAGLIIKIRCFRQHLAGLRAELTHTQNALSIVRMQITLIIKPTQERE